MENNRETSNQRQLRHNKHCVPFPNIFKKEGDIIKTGSQHIPEDIFNQIRNFQTITCEQINSLTFTTSQNRDKVVSRMNSALESQYVRITTDLQPERENEVQAEIRSIKSQNRQNEQQQLLNPPGLKNELQKLFLK